MDTENTTPEDLTDKLKEEASAEASSELPQDKSEQDTGESAKLQAEPAHEPDGLETQADNAALDTTSEVASESAPPESSEPNEPTVETAGPDSIPLPEWIIHLTRYHDDMNGLLAGKENLKIVSVNKSSRPSFYKKWVYEANQIARLTVNLRHRKRRALEKLNKTPSV